MEEARKEAQRRFLNGEFSDIGQYSAFLQGIVWYKQMVHDQHKCLTHSQETS